MTLVLKIRINKAGMPPQLEDGKKHYLSYLIGYQTKNTAISSVTHQFDLEHRRSSKWIKVIRIVAQFADVIGYHNFLANYSIKGWYPIRENGSRGPK